MVLASLDASATLLKWRVLGALGTRRHWSRIWTYRKLAYAHAVVLESGRKMVSFDGIKFIKKTYDRVNND